MRVLYEDNHVIAVVKPHGVLVQGDETGDVSLMDEVKEFLKERDKKPGNVFLGLVHRLDRPVGGITVFAKTSKGASRLSEQFRTRTVQKKYLAVVEGKPAKASGHVTQYLRKDEKTNRVHGYDAPVRDAWQADLDYRVLRFNKERTLIEVIPTTGRPHQIRVAMASLGTPIVGDQKYGAKSRLDGDIALFASELSFDQPVTKERITLTAEPEHLVFELR